MRNVDQIPSPGHIDGPAFWRTTDLRRAGWTKRMLAEAVLDGRLLRLREGVYVDAETQAGCADAGRIGGRLTCVSELARRGVFVLDVPTLHVHVEPHASPPTDRGVRARVHWRRLHRDPHPRSLAVDIVDALAQSAVCQSARALVASIDSALYVGLLRADDLDTLFASLPRRHRRLRHLLDARAESGPESLMRLILRTLGCDVQLQVGIDGVGRVDFVVDGWLIIECDSKEHHSDWEAQRADRRRDQAAAALGYATYRPIAEDIMWHRDVVRAAVAGLLELKRR